MLLPAAVQRIMSRMRQEQGREAPAAGGGARLLACLLPEPPGKPHQEGASWAEEAEVDTLLRCAVLCCG